MERLDGYDPITEINIEGYVLEENDLELIKQRREIFENLNSLSISLNEYIDESKLKSFFDSLNSVGVIRVYGLSKDEKCNLSQEYGNVE